MIEVLNDIVVHRNNSAFPTLVELDDGNLICGFCLGGGPEITGGGTEYARSEDKGKTWHHEGIILDGSESPKTANTLRLSKDRDGGVVAYGQRNYNEGDSLKFGSCRNEAVFCVSDPSGRNWGGERIIPNRFGCPVEISCPVVGLADGRWLAPAALLPAPERLGEKVIVWESADKGKTWSEGTTVFFDPQEEKGFFEQKLVETFPGRLFAFAWTVTLGAYEDLPNSYAYSADGGRTWSPALSTGIMGQTMNPLWLGEDRFLLFYNHRKNPQGIKAALAEIRGGSFEVLESEYVWLAQGSEDSERQGIDSFDDFAFGLPSPLLLDSGRILLSFWCKDPEGYLVRCMELETNCNIVR